MNKFLCMLLCMPLLLSDSLIYSMEGSKEEPAEMYYSPNMQNLLNYMQDIEKQLHPISSKIESTVRTLETTSPNSKKITEIKKGLQELKDQEAKIFNTEFIQNVLAGITGTIIDSNGKYIEKETLKIEEIRILLDKLYNSFWNPCTQETKDKIKKGNPLLMEIFNDIENYEQFAKIANIRNVIPSKVTSAIITSYMPHVYDEEQINSNIEKCTSSIAKLKTKLTEQEETLKEKRKELATTQKKMEPIAQTINSVLGLKALLTLQINQELENKRKKLNELEKSIKDTSNLITKYEGPDYKQDVDAQQELIKLQKELKKLTTQKHDLSTTLETYKKRSEGNTWTDYTRLGGTYGKDLMPCIDKLLKSE